MPEIWDPQIPTGTVQNGTDYTLVGNSANGTRKVLAGAANGIATLDSTGKLAQGVHGRIVEAVYAYGNSADNPISTTASVGVYIMPSPRVTVAMEPTYSALVIATLSAYSSAVHPYTIWMLLTKSLDGGSTWKAFGTYLGAGSAAANNRVPMTNAARYKPGISGNVTFGISIGNAAGLSNTIYVHSAVYTGLTVVVIDEG